MRYTIALISCFMSAISPPALANEWEMTGYAAFEHRQFLSDSQFTGQHQGKINPSLIIEPELYTQTGDNIFTLRLFGHFDSQDSERTHMDIRQLDWVHMQDDWEFQMGFSKVYWGVIESNHLVDIINQTDAVEDTDGEDKLGQPLLQYAMFNEWGNLRFFYLPYFRERTFVGDEGRLRGRLEVDESLARYTHAAKEWHPDLAVRYTHTWDEWDIGLAHFHGTSREPTIRMSNNGSLYPLYELIDQTSLDLQYTKESWLWKLEVIGRGGQGEYFGAMSGGFEYSFYDISSTGADIGILMEYHRDGRRFDAPQTLFDNDLFIGSRIALNDISDSDLLGGMVVDLNDGSQFFTLEASRRISDNLKIEIDARFFGNIDSAQSVYDLKRDDFIQARLSYYF